MNCDRQYQFDPDLVQDLGWRGLRRLPILMWLMVSAIYVIVSLIWNHHEQLSVRTFVEDNWGLLVDILSGVVVIAAANQLRINRHLHRWFWTTRIQQILTILVGISVIFRPAFKSDNVRFALAILALLLLVINVGLAVLARHGPQVLEQIRQYHAAEYDSPWRGSLWAWVSDLGIWMEIILLSIVCTALIESPFRGDALTNRESVPEYCWLIAAILCLVYQALGVSVLGGTLGQRAFNVRVVMQRTFKPLNFWYALLRSLVVTLPVMAVIVLVAFESMPEADGPRDTNYYIAYTAAIVLVLGLVWVAVSFGFIRPEHPHGQGLVDLFMKTISVPHEHVRCSCDEDCCMDPDENRALPYGDEDLSGA